MFFFYFFAYGLELAAHLTKFIKTVILKRIRQFTVDEESKIKKENNQK